MQVTASAGLRTAYAEGLHEHLRCPMEAHLHGAYEIGRSAIADTVAFTVNASPKWNPSRACSYHPRAAGATPV